MKQITVVGFPFQVRVVAPNELGEGYCYTHSGLHKPLEGEILLNRQGTQDARRETFLHEVLHAVCDAGGIEKDAENGMDTREWKAFTRIAYAVLKDNGFLDIQAIDKMLEEADGK